MKIIQNTFRIVINVSWKTQLAETTWLFLYICSQIDLNEVAAPVFLIIILSSTNSKDVFDFNV